MRHNVRVFGASYGNTISMSVGWFMGVVCQCMLDIWKYQAVSPNVSTAQSHNECGNDRSISFARTRLLEDAVL